MKNNTKKASGYVYGSTAYDYDKQSKVVKEKKKVESPRIRKKKVKQNKAKIKLKIIGSIAIVFLMAFITVGRYTTILALSSDIRVEKGEVAKIQKENQNINVELAKFNNLDAIEDTAKSKHGMIKPSSKDMHFIAVEPLDKKVTKEESKKTALTSIQRILGLIY